MLLLYEDNREFPVSAEPLSQVVENDAHVRKLKPKVSIKESKDVAAIFVAASSEQDLNALKVRNAALESAVTHLRSEAVVFK